MPSSVCLSLNGNFFLEMCCSNYIYSFCSTVEESESDMRFVYCACCVSYILNDWSAIDVSLTANYIKRSLVTNSVTGN